MTARIFSVAGLCLSMACCASSPAARSFAELPSRLRPGQTVSVTDMTGATIAGRVERIDPDSLSVLAGGVHHEFTADRVTRVQRRSRRAGTGALLGLGIGFGVGLAAGRSQEESGNPYLDTAAAAGSMLGGMLFGTVLGASVGAFVQTSRTVYELPGAPSALPPKPLFGAPSWVPR
jgi:hypothetical protein